MALFFFAFAFAAEELLVPDGTSPDLTSRESARELRRRTSAFESTMPYHTTCEIGKTYDLETKICKTSALDMPTQTCEELEKGVVPVSHCEAHLGARTDCVGTVLGGDTTSYDRKTSSSFEQTQMLNSVTSAEASFWGFKASVSAAYMTASARKANSVNFYIGGSTTLMTESYEDYQNARLTEPAKKLLASNWQQFKRTYGISFVSRIVYKASFIGSSQFSSTSSASAKSLSVMAALSYDAFIWSAGASQKFSTATRSAIANLQQINKARYTGLLGHVENFAGESNLSGAQELKKKWENWKAGTLANPRAFSQPKKMVVLLYTELNDFMKVLVDNYADSPEWDLILETFSLKTAGETALRMYNAERYKTTVQLKSLEALTARIPFCPIKPTAASVAALKKRTGVMRSHDIVLDEMTMADVLDLQDKIRSHNITALDSFFIAHTDDTGKVEADISRTCRRLLWTIHPNKYSPRYADGDSTNYNLADAKAACIQNAHCKAVTCSSSGDCTLRETETLVNSNSETTYTQHVHATGPRKGSLGTTCAPNDIIRNKDACYQAFRDLGISWSSVSRHWINGNLGEVPTGCSGIPHSWGWDVHFNLFGLDGGKLGRGRGDLAPICYRQL